MRSAVIDQLRYQTYGCDGKRGCEESKPTTSGRRITEFLHDWRMQFRVVRSKRGISLLENMELARQNEKKEVEGDGQFVNKERPREGSNIHI